MSTHAGEALLYPAHQRLNPVVTNIAVRAVKLSGTGHAEAVVAQAAGHQFGFVIQQAHGGGGLLRGFVVQLHGDGVAFDRVDVNAVTQLGGDGTTANARTHHHAIKALAYFFPVD